MGGGQGGRAGAGGKDGGWKQSCSQTRDPRPSVPARGEDGSPQVRPEEHTVWGAGDAAPPAAGAGRAPAPTWAKPGGGAEQTAQPQAREEPRGGQARPGLTTQLPEAADGPTQSTALSATALRPSCRSAPTFTR